MKAGCLGGFNKVTRSSMSYCRWWHVPVWFAKAGRWQAAPSRRAQCVDAASSKRIREGYVELLNPASIGRVVRSHSSFMLSACLPCAHGQAHGQAHGHAHGHGPPFPYSCRHCTMLISVNPPKHHLNVCAPNSPISVQHRAPETVLPRRLKSSGEYRR